MSAANSSSGITIQLNPKTIATTLVLLAIGFFAGALQPWWDVGATSSGEARTVTVNGEATLSATPDEFVFYPYFTASGDTSEAAQTKVRERGDPVVEQIKALGVAEEKIKVDVSSFEGFCYDESCREEDKAMQAEYRLTVTTTDKEQSDTLYALFLEVGAEGQITPGSNFSEQKQEELKNEARGKALENARSQAEQIASELGAKLGDVQSVEESQGFQDFFPLATQAISLEASSDMAAPSVLTGEQELSFGVSVIYRLK